MASRNEQQRKLELAQQLANHRQSIAVQKEQLTHQIISKKEAIQAKLNVPRRIKASVTNNPKKWFIGSTIAGLVLTRIFRSSHRRQIISSSVTEAKSSKSLLTTVALMVAKPLVKSFIMRKAKGYIAQRIAARYMHQHLEAYENQQEYYVE